ncbi:MAG: hypothetical protein LBS49_00055 [Candidatus Accumulibacter sp.]|jgi:hypothetical protein|nr:hypothetical protein [Accumulibacter sp.]
MTAAVIFNLDEKWERYENGVPQALPDYPALEEPALVLTDFGKSVSGVFVAGDNSRYLDAVITRRLRDDGLIDGEARVLIHAVERGGSSHQVFYTAVPMENWQRLQSWAESRREHCLLIAHAGLMPRLMGRGDQAVVFHCNREISLLARQQGLLGYYSIMTLSAREDDFLETAASLTRRVPANAGGAKLKLQWHTFGEPLSPGLEQALHAQLSAGNAMDMRYESVQKTNGGVASALRPLSRPFQVAKLAAGPAPAKIAWLAESLLPRLGQCLAVCTVLLSAWAGVLFYQAYSLDQEVERSRAAMRPPAEQAPPAEARGQDFAITRELIDAMANAQARIDPYAFLVDLRGVATANGVHILRVSMNGEAITVEGRIEQRGGRDDALAAFLVALRRLGFTPEAVAPSRPAQAGGFFAYRLTPGATRKGGQA